ncbi:tetratricopeptide (TPR) repeat protein [Paenibacillus rhizosphaerae]|uniref:Tetratricopeptide (TPR) repeat protein n=1 Tax=Paenibacillus rhizosphaerae TaxID=297318 RepID=A0A839TH21_9BACL|nr:tetratricopeptide repeat protein [Paenibacillus rhizosphaerae]MBB3125803.1 tetratricopeptide (TPR) repeat protein [Paenibacillus rhizosphaerae]
MFIKIALFFILARLLGNPFLAILVLLIIVYLLDRKFVGIFPSVTKPFKRMSRISKLKAHVTMSPSDVSSKHELARLLIERKKYAEALRLLESIETQSEESAEYWDDLGTIKLKLGRIQEGEQHILRALELNPRVKYGRPYLRLADIYKNTDHAKAVSYVQEFQQIQSSSCEGYYLLGMMYKSLGRSQDAKAAFQESIDLYRALPKYKKRQERKWAVLSMLRK